MGRGSIGSIDGALILSQDLMKQLGDKRIGPLARLDF